MSSSSTRISIRPIRNFHIAVPPPLRRTQKKLFEKGPFAIQSIIAALLYGVPQVDRKRIRSRYLTKLKVSRLGSFEGNRSVAG